MLFCRGSIFLAIYAYKRGGGVPPKVMTSFMNSPITSSQDFTTIHNIAWPGFTIFILGFIISFDFSGKRGKAELARETGNTEVSIEKGEAVVRSDWLERQERQKEKYDRHLWLTNSSFWRAAFAILAILPNFPCAWDMLGCALKYLKVQMFQKYLGQNILHLSRSIDDSTQLVSGP